MDESQPLLLRLTVWQRALRIRRRMHQEAEQEETDRWSKLVDAKDVSMPVHGTTQETSLEGGQREQDSGDHGMRDRLTWWGEQRESRKRWGEWKDGDNFADWYDRTR